MLRPGYQSCAASRGLGIEQVDEPLGRDHHGIVAGLDLDHLPPSCLEPVAARFQRLLDRSRADDVARGQAVAAQPHHDVAPPANASTC